MKTLHQIFDDPAHAEAAVKDLETHGFTAGEVTLLIGRRGLGACADRSAATGVVVGGCAGLLASLAAITIPGIGPLFGTGWLTPLLTGSAVGAIIGGAIGLLVRTGMTERDAHLYAETLRRGGALVVVRVPEGRAAEVRSILASHATKTTEDQRRALEREGWRRFEERARS